MANVAGSFGSRQIAVGDVETELLAHLPIAFLAGSTRIRFAEVDEVGKRRREVALVAHEAERNLWREELHERGEIELVGTDARGEPAVVRAVPDLVVIFGVEDEAVGRQPARGPVLVISAAAAHLAVVHEAVDEGLLEIRIRIHVRPAIAALVVARREKRQHVMDVVVPLRRTGLGALLARSRSSHRARFSTFSMMSLASGLMRRRLGRKAKLYSRPPRPVPILGAAVSASTAGEVARWADCLLTAGHEPAAVEAIVAAFREHAGEKPVHLQLAISYAPSRTGAEKQAVEQWAPAAIGGEVNWDLRRPSDFDTATRFVHPEDMRQSVLITDSMDEVGERIAALGALGADVVHLHQVGRNQEQFIAAAGERLLAGLAPHGD